MPPDLSILIVSYNTREDTLACLRSVFDQTTDTPFEIIVVDNASIDGSAEAIKNEFNGRVRLEALTENIGFARANNLAAQHATGDHILLLNPDTIVLDRAIDRMIAAARKHPEHRIYAGRTRFADGSPNPSSCWRPQTIRSLLAQAIGLTSLRPASRLCNPESCGKHPAGHVPIVSGCFLLIERKLWSELAGFDPAFFMYGEDADLCLRARKLGARPIVIPEATIIHFGGRSERSRPEKLTRLITAKAMLIRRHWSPAARPIGLALLALWPISRAIAWSILAILRPNARDRARTWRQVIRETGIRPPAYPSASASGPASRLKTQDSTKPPRLLAISSGGGHWVQLLRLRPAFDGFDVAYVTVRRDYAQDLAGERLHVVNDATRWNKFALALMAARIVWIMLRERPRIVISTGAAPGFFAIRLGRLLGARTIWVESIACADHISMTGRLVAPHADLMLTQWPHLADALGEHQPRYAGAVV